MRMVFRSVLGSAFLLAAAISLTHPAIAADVTVTLDAGDGFVVDGAGPSERLRVDGNTGNISRNDELFVHTTGTGSTFVGEGAGNLSDTSSGRNSAFGNGALSSNATGNGNSAFGKDALSSNAAGSENSAFGRRALSANTTGNSNSAFGSYALLNCTTTNTNAAFGHAALRDNIATGNAAFGSGAMVYNTTGISNAAFGLNSLNKNTTGNSNAAFGSIALMDNTTGVSNSAFGAKSLRANTMGASNAAFGADALVLNTIGNENAAFGRQALTANTADNNSAFGRGGLRSNTTGTNNSSLGRYALRNNTTGADNIAVGSSAGINQITGSDNIYIANDGVDAESGQIKIGTVGTHTQATVAGIHGNTSSGGIAVLVNASGVLGTVLSSIRFKEAVRDMGDASNALMQLRPVTFRYREEVAAAGGDGPEYGLIAEEVAAVAPELVAYDGEGRPYSVRYHVLPSLLLNEVQKQQRTIAEQRARLGLEIKRHDVYRGQIASLLARLDAVESQLAESTDP